jgi:CheY-like chemotaxis protein
MELEDFALAGVTVLVVDNEPEVLIVIKALLIQYQAEVIAASNGEEGLAQIQLNKPDVIISDIDMPWMDGYEFIREVRNLSSYRGGQTPAIAFTAFNRMEDRSKAMEAGFQLYLSKPVELDILINTIAGMAVQVWH